MTSDVISRSQLPQLSADWVLRHMVLFSTSGCHLCHAALTTIEAAIGHVPPEIDIVELPTPLYEALEMRIPILYVDPNARRPLVAVHHDWRWPLEPCLAWPFSVDAVRSFIRAHSHATS